MNYTYRLATVTDLDSFMPLFESSLKTQFTHYSSGSVAYFLEEEYDRGYIVQRLQDNKMNIFLALDGDSPIGFLMTGKPYGGVSFANWLAVKDEYHGKGIGTALIGEWEKSVLDNGGHKLLLWTTENNIAFYEKREFTLCGHMPDGYFGVDDYVLYKSLRPAEEKNYLRGYLNKE